MDLRFWRFKGIYRTSVIPIAIAIVLLPISVPIFIFLLPALAIFGLWWLSSYNARHARAVEINMQALNAAREEQEKEQHVSIAAKASSRTSPHKPSLSPPTQPTQAASLQPNAAIPPKQTASTTNAVGGGAILARLRAQRAAKAAAATSGTSKPQKNVTVIYASETGTAAEIAKNIHAGILSRGLQSQVASMNEIGFDSIDQHKTPIVVFVASSTGDGDCPGNAVKFYSAARRKSLPSDRLQGIQFTCLGLGDSNYTRFMQVPRQLRNRFKDLGATTFYECGEADEVDGLEEIVDSWMEGLWPALTAIARESAAYPAEEKPAGGGDDVPVLTLPPPPPPPRIRIEWMEEGGAAEAIRKQEKGDKYSAGGHHGHTQHITNQAFHDNHGGGGGDKGSEDYSVEMPFYAAVSDAFYLTTELSHPERRVIHMDLDITNSRIRYAPGDAIGVLPCNDTVLVEGIIQRLALDGNTVLDIHPANTESTINGTAVETAPGALSNQGQRQRTLPHVPTPCTLHAAFSRGFDLTTPAKKSLLRLLAEHCTEKDDKQNLYYLCSKQGKDIYAKEIVQERPTLLDLLHRYPSCHPPLDALFDALPALPPRMYSVACSPMEIPGHLHAAFTVVEERIETKTLNPTSAGNVRRGVATGWLEGVLMPLMQDRSVIQLDKQSICIPIFLRKGGHFMPPRDLSCPWIMIGPGTGVAPFRGFLQERRARSSTSTIATSAAPPNCSRGPCVLYFGCRRKDQDYLYQDDFQSFVNDGTLTTLHVAFSRAQQEKIYVQHLMKQHSKELYEMIMLKGGYVFVCGDGAAMAKDVHAALVEIIAQHGGESAMDEDAAQKELTRMAKEGRYVRDIWS